LTDTKESVDAIGTIGAIINQINDISATIASAVEEQNATMNEMTRTSAMRRVSQAKSPRILRAWRKLPKAPHAAQEIRKKAEHELARTANELKELTSRFKF
jgi:methyl-accepting chemotaxis protein